MEKILGTSKLSSQNKLTLVDAVQNKLEAEKGDLIVFFQENDKIFIRRQEMDVEEKPKMDAVIDAVIKEDIDKKGLIEKKIDSNEKKIE